MYVCVYDRQNAWVDESATKTNEQPGNKWLRAEETSGCTLIHASGMILSIKFEL